MLTAIRQFIARSWHAFTAAVLLTTSARSPERRAATVPVRHRLVVVAATFALAALLAFSTRAEAGPLATAFFFPALMIAVFFGTLRFGLLVLALSIAICAAWFLNAAQLAFFAAGAIVQTALAMVLLLLFRESRLWGVRYRRLIGAIASATALCDAEGRIERPQREFSLLTGMKWPDYAGLGWVNAVHPNDRFLLPAKGPHRDVNLHDVQVRIMDAARGDWRWYRLRATPLLGNKGEVAEWVFILSDIHDRKLAEEQRELAAGEMRHRLKNFMALVQAIATSSQPRGNASVAEFLDKFFGRLHALSAAADQVVGRPRKAIEVGTLVRETLAPFAQENSNRIAIEGPACFLTEHTGGALALGMHELATNAIKYGALSVPEGKVEVRWDRLAAEDGDEFVLDWIEKGGPPASKPVQEGYGSRLIRFVPRRERNGKVDLDFTQAGLRCRIRFLFESATSPPEQED